MHPAILLLNLVGLSIMYLAPLVAWFMLRDARERHVGRWFGAALVYALGVTLYLFVWPVAPRWAFVGSMTCSWITLSMFRSVLCHAIQDMGGACRQRLLAASTLAWALSCSLAWEMGGQLAALVWGLTGLALLEMHLLVLVARLLRREHSRGLMVLGVGLGTIACVNTIRVVLSLHSGQPHQLLDFSALSNVLTLAIFLCVLCYTMGYWGYIFEQVHKDKLAAHALALRAAERQKVSEEYSSQLEQLVQQRDHMVLVNSRFSALSTLAVFNAGIVHEISQPLLSTLMALDMLDLQLRQAQRLDLAEQAQDVVRMVNKISRVLDALRKLMKFNPPQTQAVPVQAMLGDCWPIIVSECRQRAVDLTLHLPADEDKGQVVINRVLMERVLLNLVSNALESFETPGVAAVTAPRIDVNVCTQRISGLAQVCVSLRDNGPGLAHIPTDLFAGPSTKATGLGIGLQFVRAIVAQWQGTVEIQSQTEGADTGTTVTLVLPLAQA
jgi:signal transduction histidine kinase